MQLTFHGGAKSVTGSNYLLESDGHKILIDCGLHQGDNFADRENFEPFSYSPSQIEAVVVTHAHLDHVGRLPKLYQDGFRGSIHSTAPTRDFAELIMIDSQSILCKEAMREGLPEFCSATSIQGVMHLWKSEDYHKQFVIGPFAIELYDAGHILGSSIIQIKAEGKTIVFSGDLGNFPAPIIKKTEMLSYADYCLIESTYGDRVHAGVEERREMLEDVIEDVVKEKGVLMIPAFALERTQELLYQLHQLFEQGRIPRVPIYVDSPLAIKLTGIYKRYSNFFNAETVKEVRSGDDILNFSDLHQTLSTEESKEINFAPAPKIIIAGSGMSHGGRILHHELRYLPDPKNTILFVGFQARGSLGRRLLDGASMVHIFGEEVTVRAKRRSITAYSAHADQPRLLQWLTPLKKSLKKVFVVQGEEEASEVLASKIRDELLVSAEVPNAGEVVEL